MKQFFTNVLSTIVGIFGFLIISFVLFMGSLTLVLLSLGDKKNIKDDSVLVLNLSGIMTEHATSSFMSEIVGDKIGSAGLNEVLHAIKVAKQKDEIKGIYLEGGVLSVGYAGAEAIREALSDFRKSGKWVVAYADNYTQSVYYISSVANAVWINPKGLLDWRGIVAQNQFIKNFAEKFGVRFQVIKVGQYKNATETYTQTAMSDQNKLQLTAYITGLWNNICTQVGKSRNLSVDVLNAYANTGMISMSTDQLKQNKLIDGTCYPDQLKEIILKRIYGYVKDGQNKDINKVTVADLRDCDIDKVKDKIAVYYAEGSIVQMSPGRWMGSGENIVSNKMCKDLQALAEDDDVKAVVLRVNSGGGDAFASEQIWHQVSELKKKKPVVVSMGDYAASGAYYLSCVANKIIAQPNTLTGSIGIFGVIPDVSRLLTEKLGLTYDHVKTNHFSDMGTNPGRPLNAGEEALLAGYIQRGYSLFKQRVADGRKLSLDSVEQIAQGRIWIAADALKVGLIDGIGTLDVAVQEAAKLAHLKKYGTQDFPAKKDWKQNLIEEVSPENYIRVKMKQQLGETYQAYELVRQMREMNPIQAGLPLILNIQ